MQVKGAQVGGNDPGQFVGALSIEQLFGDDPKYTYYRDNNPRLQQVLDLVADAKNRTGQDVDPVQFYKDVATASFSNGVAPRSSTSSVSEAPAGNSNYDKSVGVVDKVVEHLGASTEDMTVNNSTSAGDPNNDIKTEERDYYYRAFMDYLDAMQQSWKSANEEQRANWERAARWNEQMYDTRYQRTVADLKKAGINPLLIGGALSSQGSVSMSAAAGFSPSMPSTPYTSTSSSEISGMFNLYSTLINMTSNERVAFLQDKTKNKEIDKAYANNFVSTLGRLLGSGLTAAAMA